MTSESGLLLELMGEFDEGKEVCAECLRVRVTFECVLGSLGRGLEASRGTVVSQCLCSRGERGPGMGRRARTVTVVSQRQISDQVDEKFET